MPTYGRKGVESVGASASPISGDGSSGSPFTIANGTIALAKMADLAQDLVIGRALSAGTGVPTALTRAQLTALLNAATASLPGAFPGLDPWVTSAIVAAQARGCNEWAWSPAPVSTVAGSTSYIDNGTQGGTLNRTSNGFFYFPPQAIFQNPKGSTQWLFKVRFRQSKAAGVAEGCNIGLYDSGTNDGCWLKDDPSAPVAGKWYGGISDGAAEDTADTGVTVDTNFHDLELTHVSSNVIFKLDDVQVASIADTKLMTTPASGVMVLTGVTLKIRKVFWAWNNTGT